jgi:hypothetical protein
VLMVCHFSLHRQVLIGFKESPPGVGQSHCKMQHTDLVLSATICLLLLSPHPDELLSFLSFFLPFFLSSFLPLSLFFLSFFFSLSFFLSFFFFLAVLGFEIRAWCFPGESCLINTCH